MPAMRRMNVRTVGNVGNLRSEWKRRWILAPRTFASKFSFPSVGTFPTFRLPRIRRLHKGRLLRRCRLPSGEDEEPLPSRREHDEGSHEHERDGHHGVEPIVEDQPRSALSRYGS